MAELVAVGAGVIAILQITDRVIGLCKSFIESAKDAPSHLRVVLLEISTLRTIFENFNFLNESTGLSSVAGSMSGDDGPIEACRRALTELESLFPPEKFKKRKLMTRLEVLAWPLKENRARKLLEEIMSYKTTIMLAITTESVSVIL